MNLRRNDTRKRKDDTGAARRVAASRRGFRVINDTAMNNNSVIERKFRPIRATEFSNSGLGALAQFSADKVLLVSSSEDSLFLFSSPLPLQPLSTIGVALLSLFSEATSA